MHRDRDGRALELHRGPLSELSESDSESNPVSLSTALSRAYNDDCAVDLRSGLEVQVPSHGRNSATRASFDVASRRSQSSSEVSCPACSVFIGHVAKTGNRAHSHTSHKHSETYYRCSIVAS